MARIPDDELERIKRDVPLAELCARYGIELKPKGKDLVGCCPFHEDDTPSFLVTPSKNLWHCFGCDAGGDNVQFVIKKENISFRHAVEKLQQIGGTAPGAATVKTRQGTEHPALLDPTQGASDDELMTRVVDFYHQKFLNRPEAMQYLQKRGVFHPEAVKKFKIGYADRTLGYRIPPQTTAAGKAMKSQLQRVGILRESGHEHLTGCVVFPVWESWPDGQTGRVTEIYGRRIAPPVRDAQPHLYLPGPHHGVWNAAGVRGQRVWLLCEAILDALSFWVNDWHHVTASYGTNGFTADHWKLLREQRPDKVVICYDNDEAGNKAAHALAQQLEPEGFEAWRVELPPGSDVNDMVRSSEDAKSALGALLAGAVRLLPSNGNVTVHPATLTQEPLLAELPSESAPSPAPVTVEEKPEPSSLAAAPTPPAITANSAVFTLNAEGTRAEYAEGERAYRVLGLENNTSFGVLKVNVRLGVTRAAGAPVFYFETFDLYNARARAAFVANANQTSGVEKATLERDLNQLIGRLETHQEKRIIQKMQAVETTSTPVLTTEEESEAMTLLRHPRLLDHVVADLHKCGLVGEETNLLVAWLVSVSRKLDRPLGVCVMSRSAAGKSSLLETVGRVIPDEDKHQYTALTPQSLFHMPENELQHKALFVAEDVGAEGAAYSLKTMQSDGQLIMACATKDEATGQMMTKTKLVRGPVAVFLTSTSRSIDDELLNRLLVLSIDESPEQTQRIHQAQRYARSLEGIMERRARPRVVKRQQNLQRLIRPLLVRNPFREELTFNSTRLRSRRDNDKYLALIEVMALVHQYQREVKSAVDGDGQPFQFIDATRQDVERVDKLMADVLEQTTDELTPASRRMLAILEQMARELPLVNGHGSRGWTRRLIRERTNWSDTQVRMVLAQLVEMEYVVQIGSGGRGSLVHYQLASTLSVESSQFAVSSQSQKCELPPRVSSSLLAAKKNGNGSSQSSRRVHV
jgi:DNA primase